MNICNPSFLNVSDDIIKSQYSNYSKNISKLDISVLDVPNRVLEKTSPKKE